VVEVPRFECPEAVSMGLLNAGIEFL
jgi:hypothetical protein